MKHLLYFSCRIWRPFGLVFHYLNLAEGEPRYPDSLRVSSSGPVSDLLPSYLGDYQKTSNISSCDRPVWQHTERQDRFILYRGKLTQLPLSLFTKGGIQN